MCACRGVLLFSKSGAVKPVPSGFKNPSSVIEQNVIDTIGGTSVHT